MEITEIKRIQNPKMSFAFWCGYNGFSEIPSKNSRIIFASENLALINSFDNFLNRVLWTLDTEIFDDIVKEIKEEENEAPVLFGPSLNEVQEENSVYNSKTDNTIAFPEKDSSIVVKSEDKAV